jgi:hypothetical protein
MSPKAKLSSVIAVLVVALALSLYLIFRDAPTKNRTLTAEQLSRYQEGTFYRTTVTSTVQGPVEDQDWGVETKVLLVHEGEIDFIREIKMVSEDHAEVVVGLEILTARDLEVRLALDDLRLDLPPAVGILGKGLRRLLLPGPEGLAVDLATERAAEWLKSDANREKVLSRLNTAIEFVTGKGIGDYLLEAKLQPLEAYEGLTADYTYEAGTGLVDFQTKAVLSKEQEERVKNFSVYSEAYLLPDPDPKGPEEWPVDVKTIAHLLAPTGNLEVSGTLTLRRGETSGGQTKLSIVRGKVVFSGKGKENQVLGTWAARGFLHYDLGTHTITEGNLTGSLSLERRSTDHILFEEEFKTEPSYRVVIKGFASNDPKEARRTVENESISQ